jgi:hypothetical protein
MNNPESAPASRVFQYEETMRVLNRQAAVLSELRDRANILLAANAIAAALFGSSVLGKGHPLALKILALTAFALGIGTCIAIIWSVRDAGDLVDPSQWATRSRWPSPKRPRRWRVTFELQDVIAFVESADAARAERVAEVFELARKVNYRTIARRSKFLEAAGVLLAAQIGLWSWLVLA